MVCVLRCVACRAACWVAARRTSMRWTTSDLHRQRVLDTGNDLGQSYLKCSAVAMPTALTHAQII